MTVSEKVRVKEKLLYKILKWFALPKIKELRS